MEILTRMKPGENVIVERIQNEQVVGRRKVYINDYIVSLMSELEIGDVLSEVVKRDGELKDFLENSNDRGLLQPFLRLLIQSLPSHDLNKSQDFRELVSTAFKRVDVESLDPDHLEYLLRSVIHGVRTMPDEPVYIDLLSELLKKFMSENTKREVVERILPMFIKMSKEMDTPRLREWFEVVLPSIDPIWLMEALMKLKESKEMTVATIDLPPSAAVVKVTTKRKIFALELPKTQMRVKFHDVAFDQVGHPRLIAVVHIQENFVKDLKMFAALSEGPVTKDTPLYKYPYSNVFADGRVCWNGYVGEEIKSATDIEMLPKVFLSGANNSHLNSEVRTLFKKFEGKEFPDEVLVPFGKTLDELM